MQIVTVAPIVRGALKERLSYFTNEPLEIGMVVVVPVRSREIPAIVLETRTATSEKSTIKSSEYAIRKITHARPQHIWSPAFLNAIQKTADASAQKFGETLLTLTPKIILEAYLARELPAIHLLPESNRTKTTPVFAIQSDTKTRLEHWESLVREAFARGESLFICVPTEEDVMRVSARIGRGIPDYIFSFYGSLSKKRVIENWKNATNEKHPVVIVATPQYLSIPRYFKTIILDEEHSHAWKTMTRPLFDLRIFVEKYAQASGSIFILGAPLLRAETHERIQNGGIDKFDRVSARMSANVTTNIIDPRVEEKATHEQMGKHTLVVLSAELRALLEEAARKKESTVLLAARKGLSPITACADCGTLIRCPECETPLVLHKKRLGVEEQRVFVCHSCGFLRTPEDNVHETCPQCGGWRLEGIGISTDRIEDEVKKQFPNIPRFVLDGDRATTRAQAKKIITQFQKTPGSVLIATPMALALIDTIPHAAIVSVDSLFAIPDIRISERIFTLILALREKATSTLLIQTRADDTSIFTQALAGNLSQFIENELAMRKMFSYPPYGTIIKITLRGKREEVGSEIERLKDFLKNYSPVAPATMTKEPKNIFRMHMILKLGADSWPDDELLAKLRALPPQFTVEANPDNLL